MINSLIIILPSGSIQTVNTETCDLLGYQEAELIGQPISKILAGELDRLHSDIDNLVQQCCVRNAEKIYLAKDGKEIAAIFSGYAIRNEDGQIQGIVCMASGLMENQQKIETLQQAEDRYRSVFERAGEGFFQTTVDGNYLGVNLALAQIYGYKSPEDFINSLTNIAHQLYVNPHRRNEFRQIIEEQGEVWNFESQVYSRDGSIIWISENARARCNANGEIVGYEGTVADITERRLAQATIRYQASHDLLTNLPNRAQFNEKLSWHLAEASQKRQMLGVCFLDLDRFKTINDTLGHAVGDRLLQKVSKRVLSCLRPQDVFARWGGDEFTLLLPQLQSLEEAAEIAQKILDVLKPAFKLQGHQLHITSSIGIAVYPDDGVDGETLLSNADAALYRTKAQGRNNYQFYKAAMNSQATELLILENDLHQALAQGEFILHYQPQVNIITGEISGMEALIRWHHPTLGLIPPAKFIPLAEENGLIVPIGEWVLRTACTQNQIWQKVGLPALRMAVNLSARQFQQPNLTEMIAQILQQTGLKPEFLELEITETVAMENAETTTEILSKLHQMGVKISIDDFGTGYSSLGYLKKFPLHTLKIDRSFVQDLTDGDSASDRAGLRDAAIVMAIMALGNILNLRVIAEGVQTEEQLNCLRSLACQDMQGYLFSRPIPAEEATQLLRISALNSNCDQLAKLSQNIYHSRAESPLASVG